eukprot:SM000127S26628  [mRNA]  locus=s127:139931:146473:+ [translate_table: standard]
MAAGGGGGVAAPQHAVAVVVMGVSGAGKSSVGKLLADELGCTFLDADDFHSDESRAKMRSGIPLTEDDRAPWLRRLAELLASHVAHGRSVVLACSALQRSYRCVLDGSTPHVSGGPYSPDVTRAGPGIGLNYSVEHADTHNLNAPSCFRASAACTQDAETSTAAKHRSRVLFVYLRGSAPLFAGRLKARAAEGLHFMPPSLLQSQIDLLQVCDGEPGVITLDAAKSVSTIVSEAPAQKRMNRVQEEGGGKPGEALRRSSRNDKHTRKNKAATNHSVTPAKQAQVGEAMLLEVCPLARARGSSKGSASTQPEPRAAVKNRGPGNAGEFVAMEGVASTAARPAPLRARPWDALLVAFFALHILTTVLVDAQLVLPAERFPAALQSLVRWHVATYKDFLVGEKPLWFVSLVWCEVLIQLPFYVAAVYAFLYGRSWIRVPAIVYAAHTATTMVASRNEAGREELRPQRRWKSEGDDFHELLLRSKSLARRRVKTTFRSSIPSVDW